MSISDLELLSLNPVYYDDVHGYLKCLICEDVMKNACFAPCGCEFCEQCIKNYLSNGDKVCPGHQDNHDDHLLNFVQDINVNPATNKKICQLRVKCVKLGCDNVDTIEIMRKHVKKCNGNKIGCPFADIGCINDEHADKRELANHMLKEMIHHNKMLIKLIKNMKKENILIINEQKETNNEMNKLQRNFDELKIQNEDFARKLENIKKERGEINDKMNVITTIVVDNKNNVDVLKDEKEMWEYKIVDLETRNLEFSKKLDGIKATNRMLIMNEFELSNQFVWIIHDFSTKINEDEEIYSDVFYTHNCGYSMRLECNPCGCDEGEGSHVSLYIRFISGKYDDILDWPCKRRFFISIVNQNKGERDITEVLCDDGSSFQCFSKPKLTKLNQSFGVSTFALLSDLQYSGFLNDNKIIVKLTSKK